MEPGGGSSSVFKKQFAEASFRSSASSRMATFRPPRRRFHGQIGAQVTNHFDGKLDAFFGPADHEQIGMRIGIDEVTGSALIARFKVRSGRFTQNGLRQFARKKCLPTPLGPTKR